MNVKKLLVRLAAVAAVALTVFSPVVSWAAESAGHGDGGGHGAFAIVFLFLAVIVLASKIGGLVERMGLPPVLGELLVGIVLGNLALFGWHFFDAMKHNEFVQFLSEVGVVILLFQIGLESNIAEMRKVGVKAFLVAILGVVAPFVLGYALGPVFFPGQDTNTYLFIGAALTATSVGITARVFKDLKKLQTKEAKVVLGAAVIDDVLGLLILAVVSAIAVYGSVSLGEIGSISAKAIAFLVGAILIGTLAAPHVSKYLSKIHTGIGMKIGLALTACFGFAYLAAAVGLAPIVGAFAAGLVLDPVHFKWFKNPHFVDKLRKLAESKNCSAEFKQELNENIENFRERHIEELIEDIAHFVVPIFFVYTGMQVDITTFLNPQVLLVALVVTVIAFIGKLVAGLGVISKKEKIDKLIVGFGMVPRGEVGLIFAAVGASLGVISPEIYSIVVIMVIITTLVPPPILAHLLKKQEQRQAAAGGQA